MKTEKLFDTEKFAQVARRSVAEGAVLLKNDGGALPFTKGMKVSFFGRSQYNYYKSGTGSGGMVNTRYVTGVREALCDDGRIVLNEELSAIYDAWIKDHPFDAGEGWASEPWFQEEMEITPELAARAAASSDAALIVIGRTAGEDQDNSCSEGSYLLTAKERQMLKAVTDAFEKTVVLLNVGNIIDMKWVREFDPEAVMYIWQGGQVGGCGVVDVLMGDVTPSGRLTDTIAFDISDYPSDKSFGSKERNILSEDIYVGYRYFETFARDKVLYPFGFGLSYTEFEISTTGFERRDGAAKLFVTVTNTGKRKGMQVVQVYVEKPQGKLGKPLRELVSFAKTRELEPGEKQELVLEVSDYTLSSFDDSARTGYKNAYVLEEGEYTFYAGANVRDASRAGAFTLESTVVTCQLDEAMAPVTGFKRMRTGDLLADGIYSVEYEETPLSATDPVEERKKLLPKEIMQTGDKGYKLSDVFHGSCSMDDFIAQLSDQDLMCICRGEGMSSPKVTPGCGGAFGGVTDPLKELGIPVACCSDGPSGIRMDSGKIAFAMPNGTCLASTWNMELLEELYKWEGLELRKNRIDVLLGPGMNIHRHPLNGRNFEYFSEDPLLTGKSAAAILKGMHSVGVTGTIKHFALNSQETGRRWVEHVASQRAVREIYLKGFEIAVKEAGAHAVMSSYGPVNGYFTSASFDLLTRILRGEWGFDGIIMTDWWAESGVAGKGNRKDMASVIRAQNDLYMVCTDSASNSNGDNAQEALLEGSVTRAEFQRCAGNICRFIMGKPVFARLIGEGDELDRRLSEEADDEEILYDKMIDVRLDESGVGKVDVSAIGTARNSTNMISVAFKKWGYYKLSMTIRANAKSALAQIPLTISREGEVLKMITLKGDESEWQTIEMDLAPAFATFYLMLYFAQDGMEIRDMTITMTKEIDDWAEYLANK
ncbi:MAG: glycoside hydrolase family 3 C-terminal domain-containing protein [Butyrivibrio sp.]|nr:glycoside hydrolase family 3 C-terminal domain-containing protein [Butyrivibrio sp.]